jgi:hypothetical protein
MIRRSFRRLYKRLPKRKRMTLCLAAICEANTETPKIVLCADCERSADAVGSSEIEDKIGFVRPGWAALLAGTINRSDDLLRVYSRYFNRSAISVDPHNLLTHLRRPAAMQRKILVDEYLLHTLSFDYNYLKRNAKNLPENVVLQQIESISRIKLDASLIIAGFLKEPCYDTGTSEIKGFLGVVDEVADQHGVRDQVVLEDEFAAIGSASATALSTLYRREQSSTDSMMRTVYVLYEANRLSENIPGVGKTRININILDVDGKLTVTSDAGYDKLNELYDHFGPKPMNDLKKDWFALDAAFFEEPKKPKPSEAGQSQS